MPEIAKNPWPAFTSRITRAAAMISIKMPTTEAPMICAPRNPSAMKITAATHKKRGRWADDRTAAHVNRVRGQGDITPRRRGQSDRRDVRVDSETGILYVLDRTNDLLHVRQESAGGIHDDDEILVGRDRGLGRPMDIVGRPGIDLDVEGDEEYARGTRQRTRRRRRRGPRQGRQRGYRHGHEARDQRP